MRPPEQGTSSSLGRKLSRALQYVVAGASIAAATGARQLLDPILGEHLPFAVYFLAVAFTAWFTRAGPSVFALILGAATAQYLFVAPRHTSVLHLGDAASQVGLALYLVVGTALIAICEASRRARRRAEVREEALRITISSIGDAVITTDEQGCVALLNPVAEALTGWKQSEAVGRSLDEVFRMMSETTRQSAESPAIKGNHSVLISRDGRERIIDDSAAPIRDADGDIVGVVHIFRDITERRNSERARFQLAAIVESSDDAIIAKDLKGTITSWNRGAETLYGYTAAEAVGQSISLIVPPSRGDEVKEILERVRRGERTELHETVRVRKDGTEVDVYVKVSPVHDDAGQITGASAIARDVTAQKKAQQALRESQDRNTAMINAAIDGMITIDQQSAIVGFNPAAEKIFGYRCEEVLGRDMAEIIIPTRFRERHRKGIEHYLATGEGPVLDKHVELPAVRKDGSEFPVELAIIRINRQGPPLFTGYVRDISERKRTEEHLKFLSQASELFASSLDFDATMKNIVTLAVPTLADWAVVDIASRESDQPYRRLAVVHIDPAKTELATELRRTYPPDESTDRVLHAIRTGQSELVTEVPEEMLAAASQNEEHARILKELGIVSWMIVPLRLRDVPIGAVTFISSDSKRRFTQADLKIAEEFARRASTAFENSRLYSDAQEANRAKDNFLATLSHELRTPMTSILGWSRMLAEGNLDKETYATAVDAIQRGSEMQAGLIEDVLDMSRIASGKMRLDIQQCDLAQIAESALATVEPAATAKGITVTFDKRGPTLVTGDPGRLQQVVWNLLTNAINFTPRSGRIAVSTDQVDSHAQVTVSDTGQGFAREFGAHLFEPFRQAENVTKRSHGGLGLGLSIVRHLVEQHGGVVIADSPGIGLGATFRVRIPLRALTVEEPERGDRPIRLARESDRQPLCAEDALRDVSILFVDDQEDARSLFATILRRCGAKVATAQSVEEGMEKVNAEHFDLVVTDIAMPGHDGFELIAWLNGRPNRSDFRVIALTAFGGADDRDKLLAAGCDDYLNKPVEPADLVSTITRVTESPPPTPQTTAAH